MHARKQEASSYPIQSVSGRAPENKPKLEKVKVALNACCLLSSINQPPNDHRWLLIRGTDTHSVSFTFSVLYHTLALFVSNVGVLVLDSCSSLALYTATQARYRG